MLSALGFAIKMVLAAGFIVAPISGERAGRPEKPSGPVRTYLCGGGGGNCCFSRDRFRPAGGRSLCCHRRHILQPAPESGRPVWDTRSCGANLGGDRYRHVCRRRDAAPERLPDIPRLLRTELLPLFAGAGSEVWSNGDVARSWRI